VLQGIRSGVGVPMRWNGELRGALSVAFTTEHAIGREDLDVLEAIADLAVVACHNAEAYEDVRAAASTDALTGLLNHGAMQVRVREEIARAARDGQPLCCVLIDLDDFKRVNDEHGHACGDTVLREFAGLMNDVVREGDTAGRWGGEEFALLLPDTALDGAKRVAERLRQALEERVILSPEGEPLHVTVSLGVAAYPDLGGRAELVAAADEALYRAKRAGKNQVVVTARDDRAA
jgi:diguanylate cyclase (GGDEF)-like protein